MAHNFHRPNLPYQGASLPNDNRFQILTRALNAPPTDIMLDSELNSITDALNALDIDIEGVVAGNIPGSDNPDNANMVVTVDGNGNLPLKLISDENCEVQSISGDKLIPGSIPSDRLINNSISGTKIIDNAITENKIDDGAVTTDKIDDLAITSPKIADSAIINSKIATGAVTNSKIGSNAISTSKLIDLSVSTEKLGNLCVTTIKLADLSVSTGKLIDLSVTTVKLAALAVTAAKIANDTITFTQISNSFVATKAQQQAANSSSVFVSPATQQDHPSAMKARVVFDGATGAILASYNITSVNKISTGTFDITWITPFADTTYNLAGNAAIAGTSRFVVVDYATPPTISTMRVKVYATNNAVADADIVYCTFFGNQ